MKKTDKPNFRKWGDGMRLIDTDALIEIIRKYGVYGSGFSDEERVNNVIDTIESQPTIEAVPVVHGEWIDDTGCLDSVPQYKCSKCGKKPILSSNWVSLLTDFCPNCGADMRKKV